MPSACELQEGSEAKICCLIWNIKANRRRLPPKPLTSPPIHPSIPQQSAHRGTADRISFVRNHKPHFTPNEQRVAMAAVAALHDDDSRRCPSTTQRPTHIQERLRELSLYPKESIQFSQLDQEKNTKQRVHCGRTGFCLKIFSFFKFTTGLFRKW